MYLQRVPSELQIESGTETNICYAPPLLSEVRIQGGPQGLRTSDGALYGVPRGFQIRPAYATPRGTVSTMVDRRSDIPAQAHRSCSIFPAVSSGRGSVTKRSSAAV